MISPKPKKDTPIVLGSDMKIYIEDFNQVRYPDAVVVCESLEYHDDNQILLINALLIVEVLSPSTEDFDRGNKFEEYKSLPSFQEYLLVHQERPYASTYYREDENIWRIDATQGIEKEVKLQSIGVHINLADIYEHINFE